MNSKMELRRRGARLALLNRYISLLEKEEKRLSWLSTLPSGNSLQRAKTESDLLTITMKLLNAERELTAFEVGRKPHPAAIQGKGVQ